MSDDRWRDTYDAWKLATPPEYEIGDEERALEEEADRLRCEFRDNLRDFIKQEQGELSDAEVRLILLEICA